MNLTTKVLTDHFQPDQMTGARPLDFSFFNLTIAPPHDLIELLSLYGSGTFCCSSGDSIRIFPPDADSAEFLRYALESHAQAMANLGGDYDDAEMTLPRTFFVGHPQGLPANMIYWGHSDNGVMLCSLFMNEQMGWTTVLIDGDFQRMACYFKSPAAVILGSFMSQFFQPFIPESYGPYTFKSEQ
jgi:hypothetical protein